jgi:hypothetical protein
MKGLKNIWVWVGVAVVVIILVVWGIGRLQSHQQVAAPTVVYAPQGQLVQNFPKELILDPKAQINSTYSINYDPTTNQYTAEWNSSSSLVSLYNIYNTYFGSNGWTITNSSGATSTSKIAAMYAATSTANVNVSLVAQGQGAGVSVSYVAH